MSTIYLTHGTSLNRANNIFIHGFDSEKLVWDCADPDVTYFYQVDKFAKAECMEEDELEYQIESAIYMSNESAQITSAFEKNPGDKTIVFEIKIDYDESNKDEILGEIMEDDSCENMADCGAVCIENEIINKWIKQGIAKVKIHEFEFCPKIALCYIVSLAKNEYCLNSLNELSSIEFETLNVLAKNDFFIEELLAPDEIRVYDFQGFGNHDFNI